MEKKTVMFKMKLLPGFKNEYKKRHDEIWPERMELLKRSGISDYSISLDEETNILFGCYRLAEINKVDDLPNTEIMQKWWSYMADIMETHPNKEPVSTGLIPIFYMA